MVIDTSAVIAILLGEPSAERVISALEGHFERRMSAAAVVEAGIVMQARQGDAGERELDALLRRLRVTILPVTEEQAELARSAFRRFGKGKHPAGLNFGDCFSYALARALAEPMLFVGEDFSRTDVAIA
ncbi:MAG: type II toxin-antitoxin system VapC family toxin [Gemmatimonadetes bacterium]|nr:type II toxin-antitoxin system VapC family toxin [Gemmatimonadota bacterium]